MSLMRASAFTLQMVGVKLDSVSRAKKMATVPRDFNILDPFRSVFPDTVRISLNVVVQMVIRVNGSKSSANGREGSRAESGCRLIGVTHATKCNTFDIR